MRAKDYEGMQCPYCKHKESQLRAMLQVLRCSHCQSIFDLTYANDFTKERVVFLAQRRNPDFSNRLDQLNSEGKEWIEVLELIEKENIPYYTSPLYELGFKDHKDMSS